MGKSGAVFRGMALPVRAIRAGTIFPVLLAAALFGPFAAFADEAEELRASIVVRCLYHAGEFGNELVDICVKEDLAAARALLKYPPDSVAIVDLCAERLQGDGWARVKMCADEDIAAEEALARLDPRHGPLIAECRAKAGRFGSAKVRACVDAVTGKI